MNIPLPRLFSTSRLARLLAAALLMFAVSAPAQTISNPSFETDAFTTFPGYYFQAGNGTITGWTPSGGAGLNPSAGSPFADNGAIPAGSQVAFIQSGASASLSTLITGLTSGTTYKVNFRANARNGNQPKLRISIDTTSIMDMDVTSVGGGNPYKYVSFDFTATATSQIMKLLNNADGDNTVVIDDFTIGVSNGNWSYAAWNNDETSGIDSAYKYTHAYNFGSGGGAFINSVQFTGVGGGNPSVGGKFSTSGLDGVFNNHGNNVIGGSRQMANDFIYNGFPATITINGLTPGTEYIATIFGVGFDNAPATRASTFSAGGDRLTVDVDHFGNANGTRVSYRYTADGSGSITLTYNPTGAGSFHTYGFANRETTPTPGLNSPWSVAGWNNDATSGVDGTYLYTHAYNFGSGAGTTINGVPFTGVGGGNPSVGGSFSVSGPNAVFPGDANNVTGNSQIMANDFIYNGFPATYTLYGLTPGEEYIFTLYSVGWEGPGNRRAIFAASTNSADIDQDGYGDNNGTRISYRYVADNTGTLIVTSSPVGGNSIHNYGFSNRKANVAAPTAPSFVTQPQNQKTATYDNVVFNPVITGSPTLVYQWSKNGVAIPNQTNATLTLNSVTVADSGIYALTVTNNQGTAVSSNATLCVCLQPRPGLFSTGVDDSYVPVAGGSVETHWALTASADVNFPGPDAIVASVIPAPPWLANSALSQWIAPSADQGAGGAEGSYTFTTYFDPGAADLSQLRVLGRYAVDNSMSDILINGISIGAVAPGSFTAFTRFGITNGFQAGLNQIDFVMANAPATPNPMGLLVELSLFEPVRPQLAITRSGTNAVVSWTPGSPCMKLQSADTITGPWSTLTNAVPPSTNAIVAPANFFRVIQ